MATYLYRLGKFAYRRKAVVLSLWLAILVLAGIGAATLSGPTSNSFSIPGTPAQAALDLQAQRFGATGDPLTAVKAQYVFKAPDGSSLNTPAFTAAIDQTIANIKGIAEVSPESKAAPGTPGALVNPVVGNEQIVAQFAKLAGTNGTPADVAAANAAALSPLSANGNVGTVDVSVTGILADVTQAERDTLDQAAAPARAAGLTVELGGSVAQSNAPPGASSEAIGLAVAAVVLIIMFGSMVAAALPLITAIVGVGISIAAVTIASGFVSLGSTTSILALMIGLAVAIDYSLFILARYRHELTKTDDRAEAVGRAVGTAGSAVVFAGMTVLIALVALSVVGIPFLTQMGIAAGFAVLIAVLIALTALPALLGLFGKKTFAGKVKFVNAADPEDPNSKPANGARWARLVTKHPAITLIGGVVLLGVIAGPTTSLSLALPGISTADPSTSVRKAYDLVDAGFGAGKNGPLLVIADAQGVSGNKTQAFSDVVRTISQESDVANAQIVLVNQAGDTAQILVTPKSGPTSDATKTLVQTIRDAEGALEQSSGVKYGVTGQTALQLDVSTRLQNALIPYLAVVVGLAFILLMLVFRSILVPLTATVGFLLSVLATFGATVFIFQEGGFGLISNPQPIVSFMPVFLIGVVFGLAMDYQVFLVSRMREEYVHGAAPTDAVINGFKYGSRVVTSAAIIMISVFAGFVAQPDSFIKSIGFALAAAVFFDAFVVRMVLIPAFMALLGEKAWWLPGWLDKILPNVDIEGSKLAALADDGKPTSDSDLVGSDRQ